MTDFYYLLSLILILVSTYYFLTAENNAKRLITVNILGSGVFLFFISTAKRVPGDNPDPVPHALVLTGIVVAVSATALAVSLLLRMSRDEEE
ncbi:MAG: Na+/H+ antiporter subunit C [Aquificota bacterium]|jgi:multicomponent Na+:H+ antiporter subunit C|nr:MAG: Na+/H+ antiporter subunit C [Aquificota bacterium]